MLLESKRQTQNEGEAAAKMGDGLTHSPRGRAMARPGFIRLFFSSQSLCWVQV